VGTFGWEELKAEGLGVRQCIRSCREREMDRWRETSDLLNDYLRRKDELFGVATMKVMKLNWRRIT
jgi:hypothetical protein